MTVRLAVAADAAALAEVAAVTFPLACPPTTTEAATRDFIATNLSADRFLQYVADPDRVVLVDDRGTGAPLRGYTMLVLTETSDPDVREAIRVRPTSSSPSATSGPTTTAGAPRPPCSNAPSTRRGPTAPPACGSARTWRTPAPSASTRSTGSSKVGSKRFRFGDEYEHDHVLEIAL